MSTPPLVSIIIPVYNGSNYMREAIDSALAQTYKNIEVIVVNDGSTDSTEEIAKSYGDKIRYFTKENGGVATALNLAIKNAKGEYISWLSHDDIYYPEKIERQVELFSKLNDRNVILFSDYEFMNDESDVTGPMILDHDMLEKKPEYALLRGCINGITLLIPKKAFDEYGEFDERLRCTQDYEMWYLMMKGYEFIHMPVILAKYRMHPEQDTNKNPNVVSEGNAFWEKVASQLLAETKKRLEGSELQFYSEMALFLGGTPYSEAFDFSDNKREEILSGYAWYKQIFLRMMTILRSDILRNKVRFALGSPRKFFKKHFKKTAEKAWWFLKKNIKKIILFLNDRTIRTRFYFDGEYKKWELFDASEIENFNNEKINEGNKSICFLVPGTTISGGIAVIFKYANVLLERGYDVRILSLNNKNDGTWFPNQKVEIIPYSKIRKILSEGSIDVLIATGYSTAFTVAMAKARRKLYFVQSDESRFFPHDKRLTERIRKTYELPLECIVAVSWLKEWLKKEYQKDAYLIPNGLDLNIFHRTDLVEEKSSKIRVLIEGGINIPYKGMDDAYAAVDGLDCELWIVSNNGDPKSNWKYDRFLKDVPFNEMPKVYSSCDILLKMSKIESFCYPPLEMMACGGTAVIRRVTGIEEYAIDKDNCLIVNNVAQAREAVQKLIADNDLRQRLAENGHETAKNWNWDRSIDLLEKVIAVEKPEKYYTDTDPERYNYKEEIKGVRSSNYQL